MKSRISAKSKQATILRSKKLKRFLFLWIYIIVLVGIFYAGMGYGSVLKEKEYQGLVMIENKEVPGYLQKNVDFELFWDVWKMVKEDYYKQPVSDTQLFYGAVEGLVRAVEDPYSTFMNPEITKEFTDDINGTFEGIGAEIGFRDKILTIISPLPNSPAEQAGLKAGDMVFKIDDKESFDLSLFEAVKRIKGPKGTPVVLEVLRGEEEDTRKITIIRDTIYIKSLTYEILDDEIGYIQISSFHSDTKKLLNQALKHFSGKNISGIIVDVRNNAGGYLQTAIQIASYWIDKGEPIVFERHSDGSLQGFESHGPGYLSEFPTVVLINKGSASASEILAGALQDYGFATLIGETSFGKGSVQVFREFEEGSALKITVAEWLTPKERHIHGIGINPDEVVEISEEEIEIDTQLEKAKELLK